MSWLNTNGKTLRDKARKKFTSNAEFWLVVCNGAVGSSLVFVLELSAAFGVKVAAYREPIYYWPQTNSAGTRITDRRYTSVGATQDASGNWTTRSCCPKGIGYYCWVKTLSGLEGKHLNNDVDIRKAKLAP